MENIGFIILLIFWFVVVRIIKSVFKKYKADQGDKSTTQQPKTESQPQTFAEIFREMQRKMQEAEAKQNIPPYADPGAKTVKTVEAKVKKVQEVTRKSTVQQKHMVTEKERQDRKDADKIESDRMKRVAAEEQRAIEKKIYSVEEAGKEEEVPFELDLKNAIIGSIIFDRPYS